MISDYTCTVYRARRIADQPCYSKDWFLDKGYEFGLDVTKSCLSDVANLNRDEWKGHMLAAAQHGNPDELLLSHRPWTCFSLCLLRKCMFLILMAFDHLGKFLWCMYVGNYLFPKSMKHKNYCNVAAYGIYMLMCVCIMGVCIMGACICWYALWMHAYVLLNCLQKE